MLMLIDFIIILVYTIVEGVQGNLIAIRIPNREKLFEVEGVGHAQQYAINLNFTSCTLILLSTLIHISLALDQQVLEITTNYFVYICSSKARDIFLGVLYGYKMLLQVIAILLAFTTRKVKVKGLDDAKYIAAATYVTSIAWAVTIVSTYSLKEFVNGFAALFCTGFFIGTTFILALIFVPKVQESSDMLS